MECKTCEKEIGKKDEWVEVSEWTGRLREEVSQYHRECLNKKDKDFKTQIEEFLEKAETWIPTAKSVLSFIPSEEAKKKEK